MRKIVLFPESNTKANILMPNTLFCLVVFGAKTLCRTKGQKVSTFAILAARNYASDLTAKISALCIFPHCVPIRAFTSGCGGKPQHLSFLWAYVKDLSYCHVLEGSCSLLGFPPNWFSQLEVCWGAGRAAAVAALTDGREPLSDPPTHTNKTTSTPQDGLRPHSSSQATGCW